MPASSQTTGSATSPGETAGATWVVVPTYNEAAGLEAIVEAISAQLSEPARILVVDDASPDGTGEVADKLAGQSDQVRVLHRASKDGIGPAYIAGFGFALDAGAERVVQMDADFSHDPADVPRLLGALDDADLAIGSRYVSGGSIERWGRRRKAVSRWGSRYAQSVLGLGVSDLTGGFKAWRREALEAIDVAGVTSRGYAFQIETTWRAARAGIRIVEVPIVFHDRRVGDSKMSRAIVLEAALRVPKLRLARWRP